jgi:hypothetical protein
MSLRPVLRGSGVVGVTIAVPRGRMEDTFCSIIQQTSSTRFVGGLRSKAMGVPRVVVSFPPRASWPHARAP